MSAEEVRGSPNQPEASNGLVIESPAPVSAIPVLPAPETSVPINPPTEPVAEPSESKVSMGKKEKIPFELPSPPPTIVVKKKDRPKLVIAAWQPDENVSECFLCKRSFNPLLLRFKHHCRICGNIFCGSCTKVTAVRVPDIPPEILTCLPCNEAEVKRQEKEIIRQQKRDALKLEAEHLAELFVELRTAFEANDEERAVLLKSEIDRLKENIQKREQARQERKAEKTKVKDEKRASRGVKKSSAAIEKVNGSSGSVTTSATGVKAKKSAKATGAAVKPVSSKPLDTAETIAGKLEQRYGLEPSKLITPPYDSNRKCLVLDIDYTLFDHKWQPQVRSDRRNDKSMIPLFKRPYLHEFLETCNSKYDIIIWSATGMPAIDNKVGNLGIYTSTRYKLTAVFCKDHMIHVTKPRKGGRTYDETVKPLSVIWKRFPEFYNASNTIHIDDMISNFQLNPSNGVHILPYRESSTSPADTELLYLTKYLMLIADTEPDFSVLPHRKWKEWLIDKLWGDHMPYRFPPHVPEPPIDRVLLVESEPPKPKKSASALVRPSTPAATPTTASSSADSGGKTQIGSSSSSTSIASTIASPRPLSAISTHGPGLLVNTKLGDGDASTTPTSSSNPSSPGSYTGPLPPFSSTASQSQNGTTSSPSSPIGTRNSAIESESIAVGTPPEARSWVRSAVPRATVNTSPDSSPNASLSSSLTSLPTFQTLSRSGSSSSISTATTSTTSPTLAATESMASTPPT